MAIMANVAAIITDITAIVADIAAVVTNFDAVVADIAAVEPALGLGSNAEE